MDRWPTRPAAPCSPEPPLKTLFLLCTHGLTQGRRAFPDVELSATASAQFKYKFSSVQSLSCVRLFVTPWTAARQASLSITNSQSLFKLMSIKSVMPSNQLILCHPLLLLPSIFPNIKVFSNESVLLIRWPLQHQSFQWIFRTDFL